MSKLTEFMKGLRTTASYAVLAASASVVSTTATFAQDGAQAAEGDQIIVTGSRIARDDYTITQPTITIGQEEIENRGFNNVAQALNDIPSFGIPGASITARSNEKFDNGEPNGQAFVNFFDLGSQRTLVVVDGKRVVSQASPIFADAGQQLDLNIIPTLLIDRVETLTIGGAPIYGTDAIAGTVNIILKDRVEGAEFLAQGGLTEKGDAAHYQFGGLFGGDIAGDRGSVLFAAQYTKIEPLHPASTTRPEAFPEARFVDGRNNNPFVPEGATLGLCPSNCGNFYFFTNGGLPANDFIFRVPPTPATGIAIVDENGQQLQFAPDGSLVPYDVGLIVGNIYSFGGDGPSEFETVQVVRAQERFNFAGKADYEITDRMNFYAEAMVALQDSTNFRSQPSNNSAFFPFEEPATAIRLDNPFLQDSARAIIAANIDFNNDMAPDNNIDVDGDGVDDVPGFYLHRFHLDLEQGAPSTYEQDVYTFRSGVEGDFDLGGKTFDYELSYSFGRTESNISGLSLSDTNFVRAVDAVRVDAMQAAAINDALGQFGLNDVEAGQIVCRAQLDAALNGLPTLPGTNLIDDDFITRRIAECAPLNLLGEGAPSEAAKEFVVVNFNDSAQIQQHDIIGTVSFQPFSIGWNNAPVGFAAGFEHRRDTSTFTSGGINELGEGRVADKRSIDGQINVTEGFAEVLLPVVTSDMGVPLMQAFDIESAARFTSSSLAGSDWTYSAGAKWQVVDDLMIRGNYTKSARAPGVGEAFLAPSGAREGIGDPCDNAAIDTGPNPAVRRANCEALFAQFEAAEPGMIDADPQQAGLQTGLANFKDAGATQPVVREGNPDLSNETATAYTVGLVLTPSVAPGLSLALDWVNIKIDNVISFLDSTSLVTACFDDPEFQQFCGRIERDNMFQISNARTTFGNVGFRNMSALVATGQYQASFDDFGLEGWGDFLIKANYQYLNKFETSVLGDGSDLDPAAGEYSQPSHELRMAFNYYKERLHLYWQTTYIGSSVVDLNDPEGFRSPNKVPASTISHAAVGYQLTDNLNFRLSVNNVFDRFPKSVESASIGRAQDAPPTYDVLGRRFVLALRGRF